VTARFENLDHAELLAAASTVRAEALASVEESRSVPVLLCLLRHESAIVREGAVYGISRFIHREDVLSALKMSVLLDLSKGVKKAAAEAIEDWHHWIRKTGFRHG
jgi:hypothetical protein